MKENCASCRHDYEVTPANGAVVLYLLYPPANHVLATCPHCQNVELIYLRATAVMALLKLGAFSMIVEDDPTPDRRAAADACWKRHLEVEQESVSHVAGAPGLPEPPHEWLRQLHDDLRKFGRAA